MPQTGIEASDDNKITVITSLTTGSPSFTRILHGLHGFSQAIKNLQTLNL